MKKIKLALIGAGAFANKMHYPSLEEIEEAEMSALCDIDENRLRNTAKRFNIDKTYADYIKMLEETAVDAVYILMPPHRLFDIVMDCLERKLNVFIDKPPGITPHQTSCMASAAEKNGCLTMVGFQRRFCPVVSEARKRVEARGEIMQCMARYFKNQPDSLIYYRGAVDLLTCDVIHAVDMLRWMGGEVVRVYSDIERFHSEHENAFNALVKFESGAAGFLAANWAAGRRMFSVEMHSRGISAFAEPDEGAVVYKDNMEKGEILKSPESAGSSEPRKYTGFFSENRHFIDCMINDKLPATNFSDSVKTMELAESIRRNAAKS